MNPGGLRIAAAAIRGPDGTIYSLPAPKRHHDIIHFYGLGSTRHDDQGFVLNDGRYVQRAPALAVARRAGQLLPNGRRLQENPTSRELYSEDVW